MIQHDPSPVPHHIRDTSTDHDNHERPLPPPYALYHVNDQSDAEECDEDSVRGY